MAIGKTSIYGPPLYFYRDVMQEGSRPDQTVLRTQKFVINCTQKEW